MAALVLAAGCAPSGSGGGTAAGGSPAMSGSGGASPTGGTRGQGGTLGSGGGPSSGGSPGAGGAIATGGNPGTGGVATGAGGTGAAGRTGGGGAGAAGRTGAGGSATGGGGATTCTITAQSTQSTAIPTVFTVTWSTTLSGMTGAEIDFGPASASATMVAPVDLTAPSYKTVLVGMKPATSYVYRILARSAAGTCTSQDYTIMTGVLANAPKPTVTISAAAQHDKGFVVASSGTNGTSAYIIDPDGVVVWVAPSGVPTQPSRVHLSWDATKMYEMSLNVMNSGAGKIVIQPLDGSTSTSLSGVAASHHDLTAIPGGLATPMWNASGMDANCSIVEFTESGAKTTVVADVGTVYTSKTFHTNSIHYYERDDSYTIGDRNPNLYVKISRTGQLIWQFGGANPKDPTKNFSGVTTWQVNHGHHLTADGTFVFFNNNANEMWNYKLDTSAMKATQVMHYTASGAASNVLGDAQVLPNGNFLVTFSTGGQMHEITPSGTLVAKYAAPSGQQFGYAEFRDSLYGPPPY
jgi:Arylsulfotransferase (ASST)